MQFQHTQKCMMQFNDGLSQLNRRLAQTQLTHFAHYCIPSEDKLLLGINFCATLSLLPFTKKRAWRKVGKIFKESYVRKVGISPYMGSMANILSGCNSVLISKMLIFGAVNQPKMVDFLINHQKHLACKITSGLLLFL